MWATIITILGLAVPVAALVAFIDLCSGGIFSKRPAPEPVRDLPLEAFGCPVCHYDAEHGLTPVGTCPSCHNAAPPMKRECAQT
jgi:hypothetical protein